MLQLRGNLPAMAHDPSSFIHRLHPCPLTLSLHPTLSLLFYLHVCMIAPCNVVLFCMTDIDLMLHV